MKLNKGHEKVDISDLWNDEQAILQCRRKAAGLVADLVWSAAPNGQRGRSTTFTDAAIQTWRTLKALFGLPLLQTTGLVASPLELAGLDWSVRDFSTLCRRQKGLAVAIPYRQSSGTPHFLIERSGIKTEG